MLAERGRKNARAPAPRRGCRDRRRRCRARSGVNMLRRRLTSDCPAALKEGQPPHSTAGVASTSCTQTARCGGISASSAALAKCSAMAMASSGTDSTTPTQNRRVMSRSSGLPASPAAGVIGSSAMPQIGQLPGSSRTISGCIGQVHSVARSRRAAAADRRSARDSARARRRSARGIWRCRRDTRGRHTRRGAAPWPDRRSCRRPDRAPPHLLHGDDGRDAQRGR